MGHSATAHPIESGRALDVEHLLLDLRTDRSLQKRFNAATPEQIVGLCEERGVFVSLPLLRQLIDQSAVGDWFDESDDQELSLDQLAEVAGGRSVTNLMVSGALLAVVASNASALLAPARAVEPHAAGVATTPSEQVLVAQPTTSSSLEALGLRLLVTGTPGLDAPVAWDPASRTLSVAGAEPTAGPAAAVAQSLFQSDALEAVVTWEQLGELPAEQLGSLSTEVAERLALARQELSTLGSPRSAQAGELQASIHGALVDVCHSLEAFQARIWHLALFPGSTAAPSLSGQLRAAPGVEPSLAVA